MGILTKVGAEKVGAKFGFELRSTTELGLLFSKRGSVGDERPSEELYKEARDFSYYINRKYAPLNLCVFETGEWINLQVIFSLKKGAIKWQR